MNIENYELVQVHKSGDEMEVLIRDKNGYRAFGGKLQELPNPKSIYPPDYFDMNNEKDSEFIESLSKCFTVACNPTININDIKPRRYYIM